MKKVVLAYSGGLDTSVAVAWLREQYDVEVVTLTVDLGGGVLKEDVDRRAISAGASRAYVVDGRERFVRDFCWPHVQAGALYQGVYPLATAMARPLIAQLLVEVAHKEGADAVAHGCTGKGNDQVRFDIATHALDPSLAVIAPMRVGMGLSREQEIEYAKARNIEITISKESIYSIDVNLWGRSIEAGILEDPWTAPRDDVYRWTVDPAGARSGRDRDRLRGRRAGLARRRAARSGRARREAPRLWPAPTASGAWTTSRTDSSASRAARSTKPRRPRSSIAPTAPWRA
jgi:argininosuccinate synthase